MFILDYNFEIGCYATWSHHQYPALSKYDHVKPDIRLSSILNHSNKYLSKQFCEINKSKKFQNKVINQSAKYFNPNIAILR